MLLGQCGKTTSETWRMNELFIFLFKKQQMALLVSFGSELGFVQAKLLNFFSFWMQGNNLYVRQ